MEDIYFDLVRSPFGRIGIVWVNDSASPPVDTVRRKNVRRKNKIKVLRIFLHERNIHVGKRIMAAFPRAKKNHNRKITSILEKVKRSLEGETVHFDTSFFNKRPSSRLELEVFCAVRKVRRRNVISYKGLAEFAGARKAARAVGNIMAKNPFPTVIPCHRVVNSDGSVGKFQYGQDLKKRLLKSEGIMFDEKGRVREEFFIRRKRC